jgi:hypothetical protein
VNRGGRQTGAASASTRPQEDREVPPSVGSAADAAIAGQPSSALVLELQPSLIEALAQRVAAILGGQNSGFLDVRGAAHFLGD